MSKLRKNFITAGYCYQSITVHGGVNFLIPDTGWKEAKEQGTRWNYAASLTPRVSGTNALPPSSC